MEKTQNICTNPGTKPERGANASKVKTALVKIPTFVRWGVLAVILLAAVGGGYLLYRHLNQATTTTSGSASILQTATSRRSSIVITAAGTGTLIPRDDSSFGFSVGGTITSLNVKVGDSVEAGQVLAELDGGSVQTQYELVRLNYMNMTSASAIGAAEENIATLNTALASARSNLAYLISPGVLTWQERVADAQAALAAAQAGAAASPSDAATKKVADAQESLKLAQTNLGLARQYYYNDYALDYFAESTTDARTGQKTIAYTTNSTGEQVPVINFPSQNKIDAAWAAYDVARANLAEAQVYLKALKGETIPDDATGSQLAQLKTAWNNLQTAKKNLEGVKLLAPISGTIVSLTAGVGDTVGTNAIGSISDLGQPYRIEAYFDESDWSKIKTGNEADVTFDILPDQTFTGKVTEVTPTLVSGGGSSLVHAYIELTDTVTADIPSGTSASVDVVAGRATNVVVVPVEAVREITSGQYGVFVVENGSPVLKMVTVGLEDETYAEITSGLDAGVTVTTGIVETSK